MAVINVERRPNTESYSRESDYRERELTVRIGHESDSLVCVREDSGPPRPATAQDVRDAIYALGLVKP